MKIGKRVYRLVPCPWYDVEGIESWLESMAREGYFLRKEAFFSGFTSFEQGEPKTVRYRLEAPVFSQNQAVNRMQKRLK